MKKIQISIFVTALVLVNFESAYAYIDPSTGSYILQLVLAGLLGALFTVKIFWRKIKLTITQLFSNNHKVENNDR